MGWSNMTIQRIYGTKEQYHHHRQQLGLLRLYQRLFNNMYMQQANTENQKSKRVRVKGAQGHD